MRFFNFSISVGDFVLQKISENIISNWVETEHKNKIKDARAQGIAPPPKCKNINPPTSRFKNTTFQSSKTNSDIAKVNDEIDGSLIESNRNDSPSYYIRSSATSSNSIKVRRFELNNDDYIPEPFTATPHTVRSSRALKVPTQKLLATSSKAIEVDDSSDYNDASELSTITSHTIKLSTPSRIQTQLSTSTNMIETGNSNVNDNNDTSKFFTISPLARRSLRSSNLSSASSNRFEIDDAQLFGLPLSPVEQNRNNIGIYLYKRIRIYYRSNNNSIISLSRL
ncbi:hypothetical protein C2G38_2171772 [Gigaspora rosea]|uniref:Uncharacterized protein n=1 Tax=Gigaspora rosea TaxID=44941 RepID=A0A397VNA6_9GLOM|nr:hypothetical protein C2G38_2171772 [Gigaspora rosea]